MNATAIKGLFQDALFQVLDNRVFRVLAVLTVIPILITLLVGLSETGFSLVFGVWEIDYPEWIGMLGEDPRSALIELFLQVVVDSLIGSIGMTICIAATAFFVPRMLEKGAADLVFVKPLPRWVLYASRYITGLFFVGLLGLILTVGMYLGVLVASGVSYPGIIWSSAALLYLFAMVHSVTMLIGLVTRSTPAAMLLGILFFFGNGCVHQGWMWADMLRHEDSVVADMVGMGEDEAAEDESTEDGSTDAGADAEELDEPPSAWKQVADVALGALDVAHYVLPKTNDASLVVLHTQEAIFPSGRLATRTGMLDSFEEQNQKAAAEREHETQGDPDNWRQRNFGYGVEEYRYSAWFSLWSSLLFTLAMLGFGIWRLKKIDF